MKRKIITALLFIFFSQGYVSAQRCTTLGQTPGTAFPVCGTMVFTQTNVPICSTQSLVVPGCNDGASYADKNPYWYRFTCYTAGTLGFLITPNNLDDDYDWQLYDITGQAPNDVFNNSSLVVIGNWSGSSGLTGASASGTSSIQCASLIAANKPRFSTMPNLILGHEYLLLVSHYTNSQSGYQLSFGGGTASITDPTLPALKSVTANCDATRLTVKLNKKMKCSSLAADGSDFSLAPAGTILSATGNGCSTSFDVDSVTLILSSPLSPNNYKLVAKNGGDGNTMLDNCDHTIPVGDNVNFIINALQPTPLDSISPVGCAPASIRLAFKKPIRCSSIASNGSDFIVTGPKAITVIGASGNCNSNGESTVIDVQFASPIQQAGTYTVKLTGGIDGNTIIDQCGQQTLAGATLNFTTKDTVSALSTYQVQLGCRFDTVMFSHDGNNEVNQWTWTFNNTKTTLQDPVAIFSASSQNNIQLIVSNGVCADTVNTILVLANEVKAKFELSQIICPEDAATLKNTSTGAVDSWLWDFGNGVSSQQKSPGEQNYPLTGRETYYTIQLTATGNNGCQDVTTRRLRVLGSCYIAVPTAFSPNGDGLNDFFYPLNAFKADDLDFKVYNRWGQVVFETGDWTKKWDGTLKGIPQGSGIYVWTFRYTHRDTGQKYSLKGTVMLIR